MSFSVHFSHARQRRMVAHSPPGSIKPWTSGFWGLASPAGVQGTTSFVSLYSPFLTKLVHLFSRRGTH